MQKFLLPVLAGALLTAPVAAETTQRDLEIIGRALSFIEGARGATRVVAIVYGTGSEREARALVAVMGNGLSTGRVTLTPRLVAANDTASLAGADAAVLLGSAAGDASVFAATSAHGVMSVSTDMTCVQAGKCVMGVQSVPAVRIVVNGAAAAASSVSFAVAFAMLVEEI